MTQPRYDIALSFGSKDLETARVIAGALRARNLTVFIDERERHVLWGPALQSALHNIYRNEAHHVVVLLSQNYETPWTALERQAAQERVREGREDYILGVGLDDTQHPDFSTDRYHLVHLREGIEVIADTILSKVREIVPAPEDLRYSLITFDDISHAIAKRYSTRILVDRGLRRSALEHTILRAVRELRSKPSHRESTRSQWGSSDAHCLWIFVFDSPEDAKNNNWLCRVEWYSPDMPKGYRPAPQGTSRVHDLFITWRPDYHEYGRAFADSTMEKADYLRAVTSLANELGPLIDGLRAPFARYAHTPDDPEALLALLRKVEARISGIYEKATDVGLAPVECQDLSDTFQRMVAMAHNVILPVVSWNKARRSAAESVRLVMTHLSDFDEDRMAFKYELKKLTKY